MFEDRLRAWLAVDLRDMTQGHMPFGKYGPKHYPPHGLPLYEVPLEYLVWFARKGWPQGRLGDLLRSLHEIKAEGCDMIFDPIRQARGGRVSLREKFVKRVDIRPQTKG
jgi:uncharacterized protein (DUF3820 family)